MSSAQRGDIQYWDGSNWISLPIDVVGEVLTTHGIGVAPSWEPLVCFSSSSASSSNPSSSNPSSSNPSSSNPSSSNPSSSNPSSSNPSSSNPSSNNPSSSGSQPSSSNPSSNNPSSSGSQPSSNGPKAKVAINPGTNTAKGNGDVHLMIAKDGISAFTHNRLGDKFINIKSSLNASFNYDDNGGLAELIFFGMQDPISNKQTAITYTQSDALTVIAPYIDSVHVKSDEWPIALEHLVKTQNTLMQ